MCPHCWNDPCPDEEAEFCSLDPAGWSDDGEDDS